MVTRPRSSASWKSARVIVLSNGALVLRSATMSTPIIRPRPRTSPMKRYFSCTFFSASSMTAPTRAEFSTSLSSVRASIAASPAAPARGLPPMAGRGAARLAERRGGHVLKRRRDPAHREAAADPLADRHDVGLEAEMLRGPHFAGAAKTDQDLVGDEERAGLCRDFAHCADEVVRGNDVARRALHRLDDDRGDLALRVVLDDIAQMLGASHPAGWMLEVPRAAVAIGVGRMVHARREWSLMVAVGAAEKSDHALRLAVEAAPEADELELFGGRFREPERRFDRFR